MTYRYPVLLDVSDFLAVVVGGGAVGARKVAGLIDAGVGRVRVVSLTFDANLPASVERVAGGYDPAHLSGARLAFAATDSAEVNAAVVRDAKQMGILVNRADGDEDLSGDFTTPAQLREGGVLVTVSAGGSPAIAAAVRDGLRGKIDSRWGRLAEAMQSLRPRIRASKGLPAARRRDLFRELASPEALDVIGTGGEQSLWQWAVGRYPELEQP